MCRLSYFCSPMKPPLISEVRSLRIPPIRQTTLANGIEVFVLQDAFAEYLRFDLVIDAGRNQELHPMTSKSAALLLSEGCEGMNGKQISDQFESKGSSLHIRSSLDHTFLSFISIEDHADVLLETVAKVVMTPTYAEEEVEKYKKRQSRKLDIELRKTEVVAYREMTSIIFGEDSPYGYNSTREMYRHLTKDDIAEFYIKCLRPGKKWMFLAGNIDDRLLHKIENLFGQLPNNAFTPEIITPVHVNSLKQTAHFDMPNSVQTSLRLFRPLFTRQHQDFPEMFLLSIVFGGYFGSHLMKNIREDEGLTYGIYASLDNLRHSGYFYISTETKHSNTSLVLKLIEEEMNKMSEQLCSEEELQMVKRYIAGQFLRMMDGPLNVIKVYRTLALDGLKSDFYDELLNRVWRCTAKNLQETAQSYLRPDQFSLVTVGKQIKRPI